MRAPLLALVAGVTIALTGALPADEMVAAEEIAGTSVGFVLKGAYSNATLTVAGPADFYAKSFSRGGAVALDLKTFGALPDGTYNYQLTAAMPAGAASRNSALDDGRGSAGKTAAFAPAIRSGHFNVKGGKIVDYQASAGASSGDADAR